MCASLVIALDLGLLDLNDAFGMNLADNDRVRFRKKTTCNMLSTQGRSLILNVSMVGQLAQLGRPALPNEEFIVFWYNMDNGTNRPWAFGEILIIFNASRHFSTT